MNMPVLWKRFQQYLYMVPEFGLTLDISRIRFEDGFFSIGWLRPPRMNRNQALNRRVQK
jgi:hypothetical protein